MGTKGVADLWSIESDSHRAMFNRTMVRNVGEIEAGDDPPCRWIKNVRNFALAHGPILSGEKAKHPLLVARIDQ